MMMKTSTAIWVTVALLILLSACGEINPGDVLNGTSWTLISMNNTLPIEGRKSTLEFAEGRLSGSSGCNSFSGTYEVKGEMISTGPIAMTLMACAEIGVMEQEQLFLAYLQDVKTFKFSDGQLEIIRSNGKALKFVLQR
jgi:heat shock protein HslJ